MNKQELLLTILSEECNELAQVCSKSIRFGIDSDNNGKNKETNRQLIVREFNDVIGAITMLFKKEKVLAELLDTTMILEKIERIEQNMIRSEELGILNK